MKLLSLLQEAYKIIDLRKEDFYEDEFRIAIDEKEEKIYLYLYSENNKIKWKKVVKILYKYSHNESLPELLLTKNNALIIWGCETIGTWSGQRSRYSEPVKKYISILLDAKIINNKTKIYLGNIAGKRGEYIGTAEELYYQPKELPNQMIFYHGTSSNKLDSIFSSGLSPQTNKEMIVWKSDRLKNHPEYRLKAVYLTINKSQSSYYAMKAVNVERNKGEKGISGVVLEITIPKEYYKNLMPDDDYLTVIQYKPQKDLFGQEWVWKDPFAAFGKTWLDSMKKFSQVAYLGIIPSEWIKIYQIGKIQKGGFVHPKWEKYVENKMKLSYITEESKFIEWSYKEKPYQVPKEKFLSMIGTYEWNKLPLKAFEERWLEKRLSSYLYHIPKNFNGIKNIILVDSFAGEKFREDGCAYFINGQIVGVLFWNNNKDLEVFVVSKKYRRKGIGEKLLKYANIRYNVKSKGNILYRPSASLIHRMEVRSALKRGVEVPKEVLQDYPEYKTTVKSKS